jgi:hypothetical protein
MNVFFFFFFFFFLLDLKLLQITKKTSLFRQINLIITPFYFFLFYFIQNRLIYLQAARIQIVVSFETKRYLSFFFILH